MWWRDLEVLRREDWFTGSVDRVVGNGVDTLFWSDVWVGDVSFRVRFPRLYDLSMFKEASVAKMCQLRWGDDVQVSCWRRGLFVWEEELVGELKSLLHMVVLQVDKEDRWLWNLETSHVYSVRSAYKLLTTQPPTASVVSVSSLWNKDIPLKVVLFAWRLFRDRLPTKSNLIRRGVISGDAISCVAGCGLEESSEHLFLHCNIFGAIWHYTYRWLNVSSVSPFTVGDHFIQFTALGGLVKARQSILQVLWFATSWEIWKERNNRLFNGKQCSTLQVVDKIKSLSFLWLKAKFPSLQLNYHGWWLSSFTVLGIG
jgi:hypothetical protein